MRNVSKDHANTSNSTYNIQEKGSYGTLFIFSPNSSFNNTLDFLFLNHAAFFGQAFDEIVVSSDLNVRRKSKENRQGKRLLSNVPSGTTGTPEKPTAIASRLVSADGSRITPGKREKRGIVTERRR
jgi:hypothetical protein